MTKSRWVLIVAGFLVAAPAFGGDLDALQSAVDRDPTQPQSWLTLARALNKLGREADAIRAWEKAKPLPEACESLAGFVAVDDPHRAAELYAAAVKGYGEDRTAADRCRCEIVRIAGDNSVLEQLLAHEPNVATARELPDLVEKCGQPANLAPILRNWVIALPNEPGPAAAWAVCDNSPEMARNLRLRLRVSPNAVIVRALARMRCADDQTLIQLVQDLWGGADARRELIAGLKTETKTVQRLLPLLPLRLAHRLGNEESDLEHLVVVLGQASGELSAAEQVLRNWPRNRQSGRSFAAARLIFILQLQGKFQEEQHLAQQLLALPGPISTAFLNDHLSYAWMYLDREDEALAAAREFVKTAAADEVATARLREVEIQTWFGHMDAANAAARRLLEDFPLPFQEKEIRSRLASLAENGGDLAIAERHLRRVLELAPKDALAHNNFGYFLGDNNRRLEEAEKFCRFAVAAGHVSSEDDAGGDDPSYRDSLGWVYFRQGRLIAAQIELERALALPAGRSHSVIWDHYGDVLAARGLADKARAAWARAIESVDRERVRRDDPRPAELRRKLAGNGNRNKE